MDNLEDVKMWIAAHDGRISAYWEAQFKLNQDIKDDISNLRTRVSSLERKVIYICAIASASGAGIGNVVLNLL